MSFWIKANVVLSSLIGFGLFVIANYTTYIEEIGVGLLFGAAQLLNNWYGGTTWYYVYRRGTPRRKYVSLAVLSYIVTTATVTIFHVFIPQFF